MFPFYIAHCTLKLRLGPNKNPQVHNNNLYTIICIIAFYLIYTFFLHIYFVYFCISQYFVYSSLQVLVIIGDKSKSSPVPQNFPQQLLMNRRSIEA